MITLESKFLQRQHSAYRVRPKHNQFCLLEAVMWMREQPVIKCRHWEDHCPCSVLRGRTSCSSLLRAPQPCSARARALRVRNLCPFLHGDGKGKKLSNNSSGIKRRPGKPACPKPVCRKGMRYSTLMEQRHSASTGLFEQHSVREPMELRAGSAALCFLRATINYHKGSKLSGKSCFPTNMRHLHSFSLSGGEHIPTGS